VDRVDALRLDVTPNSIQQDGLPNPAQAHQHRAFACLPMRARWSSTRMSSTCRTVVEQHGGALDFDSPVPGRSAQAGCPGTRFRFTLPSA
jgi:hypothetical protein